MLGARSYDLEGRLNGVPTAFVLLYTRPGANALAVKEAVTKRLDEMQAGFPPGIRWIDSVRHDAVRQRVDPRGRDHAASRRWCS